MQYLYGICPFSGYSSQQAGLAAALLIFRLATYIEANFEASSYRNNELNIKVAVFPVLIYSISENYSYSCQQNLCQR
jgi:hypothetical protein